MDNKGSLKVAEVGSPVKDDEGTAKALDKDAKAKEDMEAKLKQDMAKQALQAAGDAVAKTPKSSDKTAPEGAAADPNKPPEEIAALGENKEPPEGKYCPDGCSTAGGGSYKDNKPEYTKGDPWTVTYSGTQTGPDGTVIEYRDTMAIVPGGTPPLIGVQSMVNGKVVPVFGSNGP